MSMLVVRAKVDGDGALVTADAPLLRLQQSGGADIGQQLAMPQLAQLISAALKGRRCLVRAVLLGDEKQTIHGWATVSPHPDGADISIRGWDYSTTAAHLTEFADLNAPSPMGWRWETDADLHFLALRIGPIAPPGPPEWANRPLTEVLEISYRADGIAPIVEAQRQQIRFSGQWARADRDGASCHDLILSGQPVFDASGRFGGFRGNAEPAPTMDIDQCPHFRVSDEGGKEFRFNKRVDEALRIPINRIIAAAEAIAGEAHGPVRADYARYAGDIGQAGQHLLGLVDDLVDVQNIEMPDFTVTRDRLDLADIARHAVAMLALKADEKSIHIHGPDAVESVFVAGEHRRVLQILINLLTNAVRYSAAGTEVHVRLENGLMEAQVSVEDQGCGLSAEQQNLIFEKFERLGRRDSGGSGLGLYIARKLARAMGGELRVVSVLKSGSCFTLSLPTHIKE